MTRPAPRKSSLAGASPVAPLAQEAPKATPRPQDDPSAAPQKRVETSPDTAKPATTKTSSPTRTARPGIYFHEADFMAAKSAFLADWRAGGTADKFPTWIAAALDAHASRTPHERAQLVRSATHAGRGFTRSFDIPGEVEDRMNDAIKQDNDADRWPTLSAWAGDAIAAAVERAKTRVGGSLPPAPPRLPNRLTR